MAKIAFSKLSLKKKDEVKIINIADQEVEVKQYLPINEKVELITRIISSANDNNNFANPMKVDTIMILEIIMAYTNISFTDKQKEDISKLYDAFIGTDAWNIIKEAIPKDEYDYIFGMTWDTIDKIYTYNNSVMGILDNMNKNYDKLNFDASKLEETIKDPESLKLLKEILTKMG